MLRLRNDITFERFWKDCGSQYRSLEVRCVAQRVDDTTFTNLFLSGILTRMEPDDARMQSEKDYSSLSNLGLNKLETISMFYDVLKAEEIPHFARQVDAGEVAFGANRVSLREGGQLNALYEHTGAVSHWSDFDGYSSLGFTIHAKTSAVTSQQIYNELLGKGVQNGLDELGSMWLRASRINGHATNGVVALPLYFAVQDIQIGRGDEFVLRFRAHHDFSGKLQVFFALRRDGPSGQVMFENKSLQVDESSSEPLDRDISLYTVTHKFEKVASIQDYLQLKVTSNLLGVLYEVNQPIRDMKDRTGFNDIYTNLFTQFLDLDQLTEVIKGNSNLLKGRAQPAADFERAISCVLNMLGLLNTHLGDTRFAVVKRPDGTEISDVDIIAFDGVTKRPYIIQCTINPPDQQKIDNVANISSYLRDNGFAVEPLIVVRDHASEVKRNSRSVKVVDREDLLNILQLLRQQNIQGAKERMLQPSV